MTGPTPDAALHALKGVRSERQVHSEKGHSQAENAVIETTFMQRDNIGQDNRTQGEHSTTTKALYCTPGEEHRRAVRCAGKRAADGEDRKGNQHNGATAEYLERSLG